MASSACLFPDYTFDEPEPSGGAGAGGAAGHHEGGQPTGGSGGVPSTGGMGGEGGSPPVEDCFTAGDEDNDGLADCADPDCNADLECADAIPVGWGTYGYAAVFRGAAASDPSCPPGTELVVYTGHSGLINTSAACTACDCQDPVGQTCTLSNDFDPNKAGIQGLYTRDVPCANGAATNQTTLTVPAAWDGTCSSLDAAPGGGACPGLNCNMSVKVQSASVSGGTCDPTPNGGMPSGGDPTWTEAIKVCKAIPLQGCDAPQSCVPRPSTPYEPRVCIGKPGDQTCPTGPFSLPTQGFDDFDDSRGCSECTCGPASGGVCKLAVTLYSDAGATCNSALSTNPTVLQSGGCVDLTGNPRVSGRSFTVSMPPTGGSCPVSGGGVPSGSVTETGPTTFCCLPAD